jgi:hypothetical protein
MSLNCRLLALAAAASVLASTGAGSLFASPPATSAVATQESFPASTAVAPPATRVQVTMTAAPADLAATEQALDAARRDRGPLPHATPVPVGVTAESRADSVPDPQTATGAPRPKAGVQLKAEGTFTLFRDTSFGAAIQAQTSGAAGEATVANSGPVVFGTGNWWGAISADGGQTFKYINPSTQFANLYGGFCCDQVAIYDPSRDIFIWYMQYSASGPAGSGRNAFRISTARPSEALKGHWLSWTFDSALNTEWQYPDVCLSNDSVYITTNRSPYLSDSVNNAFIFRFPLTPLANGAGFGYNFIDMAGTGLANLSLRCARGARDVAYFGSHNTTSQVRIFRFPESGTAFSWNDVNLSAPWPDGTRACPTPDNRDWCGYGDGRILAGWVSRNMIGFMWDASAGGTFPVPYVEAMRVVESTRAYLDRPFIWHTVQAHQYPAAAPNARGDVGISVHASSSTNYPLFLVGIDDDVSRDAGYGPPNWELHAVRYGTQGPNVNRWGDYYSVQPFFPSGLGWTATGDTMQGCGGNGCKESRYAVFGRERDLHAIPLGASCTLDVDGNGTADALTDGLMILRALFGLTGTSVTNGAIGSGATRNTWATIRSHLNDNCAASFAP